MGFWGEIRKQPESTRKIILWTIVIVVGLGLLFFWMYITEKRLKDFQNGKFFENIGMPNLSQNLNNAPAPEIPAANSQDVQELEKLLQEASTTQ